MPRSLLQKVLVTTLVSFPVSAFAEGRTLDVNIGTTYSFEQIVQRVIDYLAITITSVAGAMFLIGAFFIVLSGAKEDFKQRGKDLMLGSIYSVVVVLGAYGIYRTVAYFLS